MVTFVIALSLRKSTGLQQSSQHKQIGGYAFIFVLDCFLRCYTRQDHHLLRLREQRSCVAIQFFCCDRCWIASVLRFSQ